MNLSTFLGALARHGLTIGAGLLVHKGVIDGSEVEPVVGALLGLGGVAWSLIVKRNPSFGV